MVGWSLTNTGVVACCEQTKKNRVPGNQPEHMDANYPAEAMNPLDPRFHGFLGPTFQTL